MCRFSGICSSAKVCRVVSQFELFSYSIRTVKFILLAVVLSIAQASPPVPGQAPDAAASRGHGVNQHAKSHQRPTEPINAPAQKPVESHTKDNASDNSAKTNAQETVVIRGPVAVETTTDRWTKAYVIFSGLLVLIGFAGVLAAIHTLKTIRGQGQVMQRQLAAMEGQVSQMQASGQQTERLIKATADYAQAANSSSEALRRGVEAILSKERARVSIKPRAISPCSQEAGGFNAVPCHLFNSGPTQARVKEFRARLFCTSEKNAAADFRACGLALYDETIEGKQRYPERHEFLFKIEPSEFLTQEEVISIRKRESFIHFYGFVDYFDVFDKNWRINIHLRLMMHWGGIVQGQVTEQWEPTGEPHENAEIEITHKEL